MNPADFKALHDMNSRHAGILAVYQDNDPSRDMSNTDIVRAIRNIEEHNRAIFRFAESSTRSTIGDTERVSRKDREGGKPQGSATGSPDPFVFL